MKHVEAPTEYAGPGPGVFLAGGITGCPNWQAEVAHLMADDDVTLLNPRRRRFDFGNPDAAAEQVDWEFRHLHLADLILFWFPAVEIQPIALYELGAHAAADKPLAVGADPWYPRRLDVVLQLSHARPSLRVHHDLAGTVATARSLLKTCS